MSNLLLVDDDNFVRSALSRALNRTGGFTVIPAEHGRHALELLGTQHVDAILTDLQMPVMDGLTLLAELFEREVRLPVAVMTGQPIHAELRQRLQDYGIAAVFSKPVDVVSLADELQRVLDPRAVGRITGITLFGLLQLLEVERKSGLDVLKVDGAIGAALVDATSGAVLGHVAVGRGLDMERAARIAQDLVQAAFRLRDGIEDIMITVDNQYHVIRVLGAGEDMFVHLVLDRERASLGLARHQLAKLARNSGH